MPSNEQIMEKVRELAGQRGRECLGVLLYGSFAKQIADAYSDIDVLIVAARAGGQCKGIYLDDRLMDYRILTHSQVEERMVERRHDNTNTMIWNLNEGQILYDKDGQFLKLQQRAKAMWQDGPDAPGEAELEDLLRTVDTGLNTASKAVWRATKCGHDPGMTRLILHNCFLSLVWKYHRIHALWRPPVALLLEYSLRIHPRFAALCRNFIAAESFEEILAALSEVQKACLSQVPLDPRQGEAKSVERIPPKAALQRV